MGNHPALLTPQNVQESTLAEIQNFSTTLDDVAQLMSCALREVATLGQPADIPLIVSFEKVPGQSYRQFESAAWNMSISSAGQEMSHAASPMFTLVDLGMAHETMVSDGAHEFKLKNGRLYGRSLSAKKSEYVDICASLTISRVIVDAGGAWIAKEVFFGVSSPLTVTRGDAFDNFRTCYKRLINAGLSPSSHQKCQKLLEAFFKLDIEKLANTAFYPRPTEVFGVSKAGWEMGPGFFRYYAGPGLAVGPTKESTPVFCNRAGGSDFLNALVCSTEDWNTRIGKYCVGKPGESGLL